MDPNLCPFGDSFDEEIPIIQAESFATQQPPINIGSGQSYQNDHILHFDHFAGDLGYTDSSQSSRFNFQPFMDQNQLETNASHLVDLPIPSDPHAAMDDTPTYYSHNLGFLSHEYSSLSNQQIHTPPARRFTPAPDLPINFGGQSYQNAHMLHFDQNVTSFAGNLGYTDSSLLPSVIPISNNPTIQGATSSALGQTWRETSNSPSRRYKRYSREDVGQLILAVGQYGTRWTSIAQLPYFKESGRTADQLMHKWRYMLTTGAESADHQMDPEMTDLYMWAIDYENESSEMSSQQTFYAYHHPY